jgi:hypothetical protein
MTKQEHEKDTIEKFGKPFSEIHDFLDEYHSVYGGKHRFKRHNKECVEIIRKSFGETEALVAENHIKMDCNGRVPNAIDYKNGRVDFLGMGKDDYRIVDKRSGIVIVRK